MRGLQSLSLRWPDRMSHAKAQHPRTDKGPPQANNLQPRSQMKNVENGKPTSNSFNLDLKVGTS